MNKPRRIFYSWQSQIQAGACRTLIGEALDLAIERLRAQHPLLVSDRDTADEPGSPDIGLVIEKKIRRAFAVVADLSNVGNLAAPDDLEARFVPNANVLFETGLAVGAHGYERVILVKNTAMPGGTQAPFDLQQKRTLFYSSAPDDSDRAKPRKQLAKALEQRLEEILTIAPPTDDATLGLRAEQEAVHEQRLNFTIVAVAENTSLERIDDWEIELEIPNEIRMPDVYNAAFVPDRSNAIRSTYRVGHHTLKKALRPGDHHPMKLNCSLDLQVLEQTPARLGELVVARLSLRGRRAVVLQESVRNLVRWLSSRPPS